MATQQRTKSSRGSRRSNGRSASQKSEKYRFAQNVGDERTVAEREYLSYALSDPDEAGGDPDVLLDIPVVKVDSIHLELENLDAHVALKAQVLDLVKLNVGVHAHLGRVCLDIKGVEAQALLKVRLDHVAAIVDRVLTTIDRNPDLVKSLGQAVEDVGSGAGKTLGEAGEAVEDVGEGAEGAVKDVGKGAGEGVGQLGQGAGQAVGNLDQVAGGAGQAVGQLGQAAGGAGGGRGGAGGPGQQAASGAQLAKEAAKALGSAAAGEAKEVGEAATRKAKELGERRRERQAERENATPAAIEAAKELGVDLDEVEGSGAEGRITVSDVRKAG